MTAPLTLRQRIAEEQIALRGLNDDLRTAEANAESAAVEASAANPKGLGANETERKAALKRAVSDSPACTMVLRDIRKREAAITRLEAQLADQTDSDQRIRWQTRQRLVDVLDTLALAQPRRFFSGSDVDAVVDDLTSEMAVVNGKAYTTAAALAQFPPAPRQPSPAVARYRTEADSRRTTADDKVDELFG